jgi:DNA-binding PadR family transcriptional regulator
MYAYEINKELKDRFNFSTAMVTVYVVIYKLMRDGLIKLEVIDSCGNGSPRKYYTITSMGEEELKKGRELLQTILRLLE